MAPACVVLRQTSCSSTPCKIVERVVERPLDLGRILRGEDFFAPGLELLGRDAAACSSHLERPGEMLSRMAQADAQAVMAADLVMERADQPELQWKGRCGLGLAACKAAPDLAGQPGFSLRPPSDHDGVG